MTNSRFSKLAIGLATVLVSLPAFVSPVKAETIEEQNKRFLSIVYYNTGHSGYETTQEGKGLNDLFVSEGLRYCLRRYQQWSHDEIIEDQATRIINQGLREDETQEMATLFVSIDLAASKVFCPEFSQ